MSAPKKRKSDVHIDVCAHDNPEHSHSKKEKHWFEENESNGENRRTSIFKGLFKKMKSSTTLRSTNKAASTSKLELMHNDTQLSINSESSVTSAESSVASIVPNINKNAALRTFVNRDSFTPVPPIDNDEADKLELPIAGISKQDATARMEDSISISSQMSIDTIGSAHTIDEDSLSIGSTSAFCTPSRHPMHRTGLRMSTRSVPDWQGDELKPALFRSLCNSAVRRVPTSKSEGGSTPMRRSMRMSMQKRVLNSKSMEDVPEEEALTVSSISVIDAPIAEEEEDCEEKFGGAKEFFAKNVISPNDESVDEGQTILSRLSTSSEAKISTGASSVGRKNSIFRKMFPGKHETKERRLSEVFPSDYHPADSASENTRGRRASIVSFTNDCSIGVDVSRVNASVSVSSLASNDSMQKPKLRKKTPSTSNLTQRLSSVFRRNSSSAFKDEFSDGNRRNTLNGYSSISSGIGSIASGISDSGYSMTSRNGGQSISRNGSKREDENKRERSQRLLDRIIISDVPAGELLKMKMEILKKRDQKVMNEQFETQLNESDSSTNLPNELLNFDTIAVDVNPNGKPFSSVAATIIDEKIENTVRNEVMFRPDRCGTITDCEPELIFVCQEPTPSIQKNPNDSMCSNLDVNSDLLRNVRSGLCKSIEEWKKLSDSRESSTMLIYPMFCQSEAEWDSKATIDAIFLMLDGILLNARRWRANGKCILAGLTPNNVRLLKEKYDEVKQSVLMTEVPDGPISSVDDLDVQSITSNSTIFGTKI